MENNRLREFVDSLSFRELMISLDLVATLGILYFYLVRLLAATPEMLADASFISTLLLKVIVFSVAISIVSSLLLEFISDGELEQPLDEREKLISLSGNKYALWILQVGVCIAFFQYTAEAHNFGPAAEYNIPFLPLHIMLVSFLLSEAVNYLMQLVKGRAGDIYG